MKLLMIYCSRFAYNPTVKVLEDANDGYVPAEFENILTAFIQAEEKDEDDLKGVEKKLVKNLKWGARKNETRRIVLHSFSHLAETKATPDFTKALLMRAKERLHKAGYIVWQTPFGYFLDLDLHAPGRSTARIFTSF